MNHEETEKKVNYLIDKIDKLRFSQTEKTIELSKEIYSLSKNINYSYGLAKSNLVYGEALCFSGNYQKGIINILKSIEIYEDINDKNH